MRHLGGSAERYVIERVGHTVRKAALEQRTRIEEVTVERRRQETDHGDFWQRFLLNNCTLMSEAYTVQNLYNMPSRCRPTAVSKWSDEEHLDQ